MATFTCVCGSVTHDSDEPTGASLVAYPLPTLNAIERNIAQHVTTFLSLPTAEERAAWQRSFFAVHTPAAQSQRDVVEDIVSFELNEGFTSVYRCQACGRIAMKDGGSARWCFFRPEP
ncbi:MAG: hypothetical protein BWK76_15265 [Desulfobulbaceae bacterium A2]|nr:MAG: hypothetical protein BWK76_15265 [Desulfobulbaceae bacterium A2]